MPHNPYQGPFDPAEITPEMIEAGLDVLCDELGLVPGPTASGIVEDIYRAMRAADSAIAKLRRE